jgi:hypothetical protein
MGPATKSGGHFAGKKILMQIVLLHQQIISTNALSKCRRIGKMMLNFYRKYNDDFISVETGWQLSLALLK